MKRNSLFILVTLGYFYLWVVVPVIMLLYIANGMAGNDSMSENYSFLWKNLFVYVLFFLIMILYTVFRKHWFMLKDIVLRNKVIIIIVLTVLIILVNELLIPVCLIGFFNYAFTVLEGWMKKGLPKGIAKNAFFVCSPLLTILLWFLTIILVNR